MKRIYGLFAAVLVLAASCAKEIALTDVEGQKTVLTAGVDATKTVLDGAKVYWTDGDQIAVNGVSSESLSLNEPSAKASFIFNGILDAPYKAVFPASVYKDEGTVTLPAVQGYHESSFHATASPMIAYAENNNLSFSHPFSVVVVYVNLKDDTDKIAYLEFWGNDGEQICGDFAVDYQAKTITGAGANADNTKVRVNIDREISAEAPMAVHIVVPARTYARGFTVKVADENGHYMTKGTTSERVCKAGTLYSMKAFDFVPSSTEIGVEIASAADLITFAKAWNAGEYESTEENPLTVVMTRNISFSESENAQWETEAKGIGNGTPFTGVFDGQNHKISGFTSYLPVFHEVGNSPIGTVRNLSLEGSVVRDLDGITGTTNVGTLIGISRGYINNCHSSADLTVAAATIADNLRVGGLVAYTTNGYIINSSYSGNIVVEPEFVTTGSEFYLGGLTSYTNTETAYLENSQMGGTIKVQGNLDASVYIGGLAGYVKQRVTGCSVLKNSSLAYGENANATIIIDAQIKDGRIGGLLGQTGGTGDVESSKNNADVIIGSAEITSLDFGGLVGRISGSQKVSGSGNTGNLTTYAPAASQDFGALVGFAHRNATANNLTNSGAVLADKVISGSQTLNLAGGVGSNEGTVSNLTNNSAVTLVTEGWGNADGVFVGGVLGRSVKSVSGLVNKGNVTLNDASTKGGANMFIGGVIGGHPATESAPVTISVTGCSNSGTVNINVTGSARLFNNIFAGGIIGYDQEYSTLTMTSCENTGDILGGFATSVGEANYGAIYFGGLAGYLRGTVSVSSCHNYGDVNNAHYANATSVSKAPMAGGIAGRVRGSSATAKVTLTSCTSVSRNGSSIGGKRGWVGGITGYAGYATVVDCDVDMNIDGSSYYNGLISGQVDNASIENCTAEGNIKATQNKYMGGICGQSLNTSSITNCTYSGTLNNLYGSDVKGVAGGIIGHINSGTLTVTGCKFSGDIRGTAMTIDNLSGSKANAATLSSSSNSLLQ